MDPTRTRRELKQTCAKTGDAGDDKIVRHAATMAAAAKYLRQSYMVLGVWGLFSVFIVVIVAYMGYQLFKSVLEYYQLRGGMAAIRKNSLDPGDDNEVYASYNTVQKVPGGNEIINRVKRIGMSGKRFKDIRDSLDSDKDRYVKPEVQEDPEDD